MTKLIGLLITTLLLATARDGLAADSGGQYVVYGNRTCWDYIVYADTGNPVELEKYLVWISGYVTAYNRLTPDTLTVLGGGDLNMAMIWLAQWCRANPKSAMDAAMHALTQEFHPRRHRTVKDATK